MPAYCPRCGLSKFERRNGAATSPAASTAAALEHSSVYAAPSNNPTRRIITPSAGSGPHRERRGAKRVHPKEPVEVRLSWLGPLKAVNISASGLLVEHSTPFKPGAVCDVQLYRTGRTIQLRGQVVRSAGANGDGGSRPAFRYRTGVRFLEIPQSIFAFLPELSEGLASSNPSLIT